MTADAFPVALLGFSDFERQTLSSCLRLTQGRTPHFLAVAELSAAQLVVADGNHAASMHTLQQQQMLPRTLVIGPHAPPDAGAWMLRPIEPAHVLYQLDLLVARGAARAPSSGVPRALIVDDSAIAQRFLQTRLASWALHADLAASSQEALELLAQGRHGLVFLDVDLGPGSAWDGLALCKHLKRQQGTAAQVMPWVAMVSAHHSEMDRVRGSLAGCDAYLGKPLDEAELCKLLRRQGLHMPGAAGR
jgi:two-component system cell cycle response regulator